MIEGGTSIAIFIRCFADKKGIEEELKKRLHTKFPREVLATISVIFNFFFDFFPTSLNFSYKLMVF